MIQELKTYYYANGISAFGFRCHLANSCRLFCNNFVEAQESYVGSEYEKEYDKQQDTIPRVLFLSSDPGGRDPNPQTGSGDPNPQTGSGDPNPQTRTMEAARRYEEEKCDPESPQSLPRKGHWYHTHHLAWIFKKI